MPRQSLSDRQVGDVRSRIVREATAIVGRTGLDSLSMRALGEGVGLTPGALYRYFPSKQDLLRAMWQNAIDELKAVFAKLGATENPLEAVRGLMKAYSDFALADPDRFRVLFLENDQGSLDHLSSELNALAPYDVLRDRVLLASRNRLLRSGDIDRVSQLLWASVHGALTLAITVREVDFGDVDDFVNDMIETVLRGLRPEESEESSDAR